jgi:Glycosyltransferase like family 2
MRAPDPANLAWRLLVSNAIPGGCSNAIAERDLVRSVGGFDENISGFADWDLWIRLALAASAAATEDVVVAYLRHQGSASQYDLVKEFQYLAKKHHSTAEQLGVTFDRKDVYRYIARQQRRARRPVRAASTYAGLAVTERSVDDAVRAAASLRDLIPSEIRRMLKALLRRGQRHAPIAIDLPWLSSSPPPSDPKEAPVAKSAER